MENLAMGIGGKRRKFHIRNHGVTFEQASLVFADKYALNKYDEEHSGNEDRWIILGKSFNEILLLVVHTFRNRDGRRIHKNY